MLAALVDTALVDAALVDALVGDDVVDDDAVDALVGDDVVDDDAVDALVDAVPAVDAVDADGTVDAGRYRGGISTPIESTPDFDASDAPTSGLRPAGLGSPTT